MSFSQSGDVFMNKIIRKRYVNEYNIPLAQITPLSLPPLSVKLESHHITHHREATAKGTGF